MKLEITPEPTEQERRAILAALADDGRPEYASPWRAAALQELRDGALAEEPGGDPRVVES